WRTASSVRQTFVSLSLQSAPSGGGLCHVFHSAFVSLRICWGVRAPAQFVMSVERASASPAFSAKAAANPNHPSLSSDFSSPTEMSLPLQSTLVPISLPPLTLLNAPSQSARSSPPSGT